MTISGIVGLLAGIICLDHFAIHDVNAKELLGRFGSLQQELLGQHSSGDLGNNHANTDWDIFYHMGGNSPWLRKTQGVVEGGIELPEDCHVQQVHMMSRHAERYPTLLAGISMLELYQHIQKANVTLTGELAFANTWDFFMKDPSERLDNLVATGPHAGTLDAFATGVKLRTRYEQLLDWAIEQNQTTFWASGSKRVIETAEYFAAGFFNLKWQEIANLEVIPETEDRGGDTLTAGKTCSRYLHNADESGRGLGYRKFQEWREAYLPRIVERLNKKNPGIEFMAQEIYSMQELCGFETIAKGRSGWCEVLTPDEWLQFEYARDLLHYYRTGPGSPYSANIGWLWLNATASLLQQGPAAGTLFFSFIHDGDIIPLLTALDLLPPEPEPLPTTHIPHERAWRTSDLVPMGGRIILERLVRGEPEECWNRAEFGYPNHVYCSPSTQEHFVRINVNDGIVALPGCDSGPGRSCPLQQFLERVKRKGEEVGDFREVCGLAMTAMPGIEFLHQ